MRNVFFFFRRTVTILLQDPETGCIIGERHSGNTTSHCQGTNDRISIINLSQQYQWGLQSNRNCVTDLKRTTNLVTLEIMQVLHAYGCHSMQNGRFGNSEISEVTQTMHFHTALALFMGIMHHLDKMYIPGGARLLWQQRRSSRKSKTGSTSSWRSSDKLEWGQNFANRNEQQVGEIQEIGAPGVLDTSSQPTSLANFVHTYSAGQ